MIAMGLTLGFAFTVFRIPFVVVYVPVNNAAPGQVVGRQLHHDAAPGRMRM